MKDREKIAAFYISQIQDDFLPYWQSKYDETDQGILNCINNTGDQILSDQKFTWSQGRYLWILSKLYQLTTENVFCKISPELLLKQMRGTKDFLLDYALCPDGRCHFLLSRKGEPVVDPALGRSDTSIFADCFALIGLAAYITATGDHTGLQQAIQLFAGIQKRIVSGDYLTEPYPIPEGYRMHSIPMILVNTAFEFAQMQEACQLDAADTIRYGLSKVSEILEEFYRDGFIREHISTEENYEHKLLDRHMNPGHTIEDVWFMIEFLKKYGSLNSQMEKLELVTINAMEKGWDPIYGGLLRFVDRSGAMPSGEAGDSAYEKLILDTWDMKLWWPHSEILYTTLLLYTLTDKEIYWQWYQKAADYIFSVFPNQQIGEWIQIRQRDGKPQDKVVALPVKDPFHIMRNFIKIVELLR